MQSVPGHIARPPYAETGLVKHSNVDYEIKDEESIAKMKEAAKIAAQCLKLCLENSKAGVTTDEIDKMAFNFYVEKGAYPAGINFHGFPKTVCASPNEGTAAPFGDRSWFSDVQGDYGQTVVPVG